MIWVVGARGMLGQDLVSRLDALGFSHVDSDLECDITDLAAVRAFAAEHAASEPIDWLLNCSAYTAVDRAEEEQEKAHAVNAVGPENLARVAREIGARIVHVSTDYVFDGEASAPYTEEASVAPQGAYGRTKAEGERRLLAATPEHFIVRTAWLYGLRGNNFVATMLRLMNEREELTVVNDQHGSPTYSRDLAAACAEIIRSDSRAFGIYHFTNAGETTWYEFARAIYELGRHRGRITHECRIRPCSSAEYPTKAVRPKYSVLDTAKIRTQFGIGIPTWKAGLDRYFDELDGIEAPSAPTRRD